MSHSLMILIVALGGAFGAVTRFQVTHWFVLWLGSSFPYATLAVNVMGSFIIGLLVSALNHNLLISPHWRPFVIVGFLGALTTFSTFSLDTFLFFMHGQWLKAAINVLLNLILCFIAVACGYYLLSKGQQIL